jgi:uncharacterized protein YdaT
MATVKQRKAFKRVVEKGRPVSRAMVEVGYSENTAVAPSKLTNSKGWAELMNEYMPKDLVMKRHKQLLMKNDENGQPETQAVSKALEMNYKLDGAYAPEKHLNLNVQAEPSERIKELAKRLKELDA